MIYLTIIQLILYLAAFAMGIKFFITKKSPLYFKLLFYGVACFLLEELYYIVSFVCTGEWSSFSFAMFGAGAAYAFMFSANYGQFDGFVDDNSEGCRKARIIAFLVPALLLAIYSITANYYLKAGGKLSLIILTILSKLPAFFAAYYHFKHLILPDRVHFVIDSLRPCNAMCLLLIVSDVLSDALFGFGKVNGYAIFETIGAALLVLVMITAERGRKEWKI